MSYLLAGAVSLVIISSQLLDGVANFMYSNMTKKLSGHMNYIVNQKLIRLKAILYEDPNKLDLINKAFESSTKCVGLVFTFISMLAFHIPYLIFMLFYLASIQPWLCVILLLMFVPMSVSQLIKSTFFAKQEDHSAPLRRSLEEYENNICSKIFFKETRTLGIYGFFRKRYINILDDLNKLNWKTERKSCIIELCTRLVAMIGYMVLLVVLIVFSVQGIISIGQFAAVFSSIGLAFSVMQGVVDRNLGLVSRNIGFTKNYVNFMDLPELSPEFNFCESDNDDIILKDVGINETRTGIIDVLKAMGANIELLNVRDEVEPIADIRVRYAKLHGTSFGADIMPRLIDEIPIITVASMFAEGETTITGAGELRVKETDRLQVITDEFNKVCPCIKGTQDGLIITGSQRNNLQKAVCNSHDDHRIAMALAILGASGVGIEIENSECVNISYPTFYDILTRFE